MPRVPFVDFEKLPQDARERALSVISPATTIGRPFSVLLHSPEGAARYYHLSNYNREASTIEPRLRELVILVVAKGWASDYIWEAHAGTARRLGVSDDIIDALKDGKVPAGLEKESPYLRFAEQLVGRRRVDDAVFQEVHKAGGERGVVDLVILIGYYTMQAHTLAALEVERGQGG
jgi:4-carboxymuconolactone decarboxylase